MLEVRESTLAGSLPRSSSKGTLGRLAGRPPEENPKIIDGVRVRFSSIPVASRVGDGHRAVQQFEEWFAGVFQLFFEPRGAVAISAGPRLGAILVAAFAPVVSVLHLD